MSNLNGWDVAVCSGNFCSHEACMDVADFMDLGFGSWTAPAKDSPIDHTKPHKFSDDCGEDCAELVEE